jgi:hypothetical protein
MAARKYDYLFEEEDETRALDTCLHDQKRHARSSRTSGLYQLDLATPTRSGIAPVHRSSAPRQPAIPRAGGVPEFVVGDRMSAFAFHAAPRPLPIAAIIVGTMMLLAVTVLLAIAYYR